MNVLIFLLAATTLLLPAHLGAQSIATGTIGGVVRDTSAGVLPGVTVEAASPALIEKVRSVVTDEQGVFKIIDLRPGTYSVTFTLPGFKTFRREGIELTTGFTATVNADLAVGELAETITVSGAAPLVDTQNVSQQRVFAREVTENLPVGGTVNIYATLIPGVTYNSGAAAQDVGGSKGEFQQGFSIHGGRANDFQQLRDGMFFGTLVAAGNRMTSLNPATISETTVQTSSATAELESGGALVNVVPRDGGNTFSGTFNGSFSTKQMQGTNLSDALRARGVTAVPELRRRYDTGGGVGGPLKRDRVWFFLSLRSWVTSEFQPGNYYNATPGTLFYTPDLNRPAFDNNYYKEARIRTTVQATPKDKVTAMFGNEWNCNCPNNITNGTRSPEANAKALYSPNWQTQFTWSRPQTSRVLFEAGATVVNGTLKLTRFAGSPNDPYVLDQSRNFGYGNVAFALGATGAFGYQDFGQTNQKFSVSYVTGSHSFKAGTQMMYGWRNALFTLDDGLSNQSYVFNGRVPTAVTYFAGPLGDKERLRTIGVYAQDQWTIDRLTLNLGLRFDYLNGRVPAVSLPAGTFVRERSYPEVKNVPRWKDWNSRLGAAYDVFGNGQTAIKGFVGRYVVFEPIGGLVTANSPANLVVTSATRAWTDNGDYIPQEVELGPLSNSQFGQSVRATTYDPEVLTGNRQYDWQASLQLQQELWNGVAVNVGYFRTWYGNFRVTQNRAVQPGDFTPFCVAAPTAEGLPGSGSQLCGLYDVVPTKFGQTDNFVTLAKNFGKQSEVFNGVDASMTARLRGGAFVQAGLATGATSRDNCYQNNLPNVLAQDALATSPRTDAFCSVSPSWSGGTQFKAAVVYPIAWGVQVSANYQNIAGISEIANAVYNNAAVATTLGRSLAACGTRVPCTSTITVDVIPNNIHYREPRSQQIDLRFSRIFRLPNNGRIQPQLDIFNITNGNSVLALNGRIGPAWRNATAILAPRVLRVGVNMNF
jgi:hypothetical protein